jgi:hypothetical protein
MFLRIADITITITSDDPELKLQAEGAVRKFLIDGEGAVRKFLIDGADPDVRIQMAWGILSEEIRSEKIFDSGTFWQLYDGDGSYLFRFVLPGFGSLPYKVATFDRDFSFGEVYLHRPFFKPELPVAPLDSSLDQLLITNWLAKGRGAEVHACGLVDSLGRGHLFVGQSTAGKTTMAKLWESEPNSIILSDDRIILRRTGNKIWMYGTPWHGEAMLACPTRAALTAVYFLGRGQKNELVTQKALDSISRLFACSFPPFYDRDALDFTLTFLEDVVRNVPCYELKFRPDKRIVELISSNKDFHSL